MADWFDFADFGSKLWDKGVDIIATAIASTISALFIAIIAAITWNWKKNRDLRYEEEKQRQQYRVESELAAETAAAERLEVCRRLKVELQQHATQIETASSPRALHLNVQQFLKWLNVNGLQHPANTHVLNEFGKYKPTSLDRISDENVQPIGKELANAARETVVDLGR